MSDESNMAKMGKYGIIMNPKVVSQKGVRNPKKWSPRVLEATFLGEGSEKSSEFSRFFEDLVKTVKIATFSTFLVPRQKCQTGPDLRAIFSKTDHFDQNKRCLIAKYPLF